MFPLLFISPIPDTFTLDLGYFWWLQRRYAPLSQSSSRIIRPVVRQY